MRLALLLLLTALATAAQTAPPAHPATDSEKIADALRAGPAFITKDATILDWPTTKGGEYRVLRKGSSEWTCLPAFPGSAGSEVCWFRHMTKATSRDMPDQRSVRANGQCENCFSCWRAEATSRPATPVAAEHKKGRRPGTQVAAWPTGLSL